MQALLHLRTHHLIYLSLRLPLLPLSEVGWRGSDTGKNSHHLKVQELPFSPTFFYYYTFTLLTHFNNLLPRKRVRVHPKEGHGVRSAQEDGELAAVQGIADKLNPYDPPSRVRQHRHLARHSSAHSHHTPTPRRPSSSFLYARSPPCLGCRSYCCH